jgi:phosphoglycerol transferase MdoB-like AlkP superfamily enzyme
VNASPVRASSAVLSLLLGAAPFGVGVFRAVGHHDLRFLWMAVVAFIASAAVMMIGHQSDSDLAPVLKRSAAAMLVATVLAALAARLLGATAMVGVWMVAIVLGFFSTASHTVRALSRRRSTG